MLRSRDYDSLGGELSHTDGCSHVMSGFTLVSNKGGCLKRSANTVWTVSELVLEVGCSED